jgi:hypothetical protein
MPRAMQINRLFKEKKDSHAVLDVIPLSSHLWSNESAKYSGILFQLYDGLPVFFTK